MKRKLFTPLSMGAMALALVMVACGKAPQLTRDNVDDVLARMTLDEKINIVVGAGNETFTGYGNTKKLVPGAAGTTSPIPRLGIPPTALTDGPAGLRIDTMREGQSRRYYHTGFPIGTALASSWNQPLIQEVGEAIGNEAHEYGLDLICTATRSEAATSSTTPKTRCSPVRWRQPLCAASRASMSAPPSSILP